MSVGGSVDTVGDNKEFALATTDDVTIYFVSTSTSSSDTSTAKYFDTNGTVKRFCLRCDQAVQIVSMTGVTMTTPISVLVNTAGKTTGIHTEEFDVPTLTRMVIRPTVAGTNIKLRIHGRG